MVMGLAVQGRVVVRCQHDSIILARALGTAVVYHLLHDQKG